MPALFLKIIFAAVSVVTLVAFSALTLLVGWQEGHPAYKNHGGWWRWAMVSPDGVAPSRMVGVSASVSLPLYHKVQKFYSGTGSPRWSLKKGRKPVVVWWSAVVFGNTLSVVYMMMMLAK